MFIASLIESPFLDTRMWQKRKTQLANKERLSIGIVPDRCVGFRFTRTALHHQFERSIQVLQTPSAFIRTDNVFMMRCSTATTLSNLPRTRVSLFAVPRTQSAFHRRTWCCDSCLGNLVTSHAAVIRVYDATGTVIETHQHKGDFKEWW